MRADGIDHWREVAAQGLGVPKVLLAQLLTESVYTGNLICANYVRSSFAETKVKRYA